MKANELMIGDWIIIDDVPTKVESIYKHSYHYRVNDDTNYVDNCKPIPLTEEILKANGFELKEEINNCTRDYFLPQPYCKGVQWCHAKVIDIFKDGIAIDMEASDYSLFRSNVSFKYLSNSNCCVHEFQHALRLCGLNELADNFKLKEDIL